MLHFPFVLQTLSLRLPVSSSERVRITRGLHRGIEREPVTCLHDVQPLKILENSPSLRWQ